MRRPKRSSGSDFWNLVAAEPKWIPEIGLEAEWERRRGKRWSGGQDAVYMALRKRPCQLPPVLSPHSPAAEMRAGRGDADLG